ncbi:MAG: uroporphyrinogen decarboxylase family protein [Armatimonadota bacterium]
MTGAENAYRTLMGEDTGQPCCLGDWMFNPAFFRAVTGRSISENPTEVAIEAFRRVGVNLTPQFAIPATDEYAPYGGVREFPFTPESICEEIDQLPDLDTLERDYDFEGAVESYAGRIVSLRETSGDDILHIAGFGIPSFMLGNYNWGYEAFLSAMMLYPEHIHRWYAHHAELGRLLNLAIIEGVRRYSLAPFVYGGDDICFNDGPMCSVSLLEKIYFPEMKRAIQPLHDAGVRIIWHCDGNIVPILPNLLEAGMWGFQGFQEETGPTLELMASQRTIWDTRPVLWGSISVTSTLPFGTVDDVRADVDRCFDTCPGGGFVLAQTSSIMPEVPVENILAMYERAHER